MGGTSLSRPWITIVIATYNSSRFLPRIWESLNSQRVPENVEPMEIITVDGGSQDDSKHLAAKFGFRVIENPAGHAIAAKHIGLNAARSRLVCFLDHDELLMSRDSLFNRYELFQQHSNLRAMISAGSSFSQADSTSNMYASEFGDPVSMMTYRCPNSDKFRINALNKRLKVFSVDKKSVLYVAGSEKKPILCELVAGSGLVDVDYFRNKFPFVLEDENCVPHLYYYFGQTDELDLVGVIKGDSVSHDSVDSWSSVRKKISWRVNNGINSTEISGSGFSGRQHSPLYSPKKQLLMYAIYCLLFFGPIYDSLYLAVTRRRFAYVNHFCLSYFVLFKAAQLKIKKLIGKNTGTRYGGS